MTTTTTEHHGASGDGDLCLCGQPMPCATTREVLDVLGGGSEDCGCYVAQEGGVICDMCDREVTPGCAAIHISTGHMEGPNGERGFDICRDCGAAYPGFLNAVTRASACVHGKWEAKRAPRREYEAALREARQAFKDATASQYEAYRARVDELGERLNAATGETRSQWDLNPSLNGLV